MAWFEEQLANEVDHKFIIISHVYAGARYSAFSLWKEEPAAEYFRILEQYADKIIIEISGHDHIPSLRVHEKQNTEGEYFHNIFIAPSITPWYHNNPGVTSLEISDSLVA